MHWPDARSFWGNAGISTQGPLTLPGAYAVRLSAGGKQFTQTFRLKLDPRSHVSPADLRAQFAFVEQVRDTVNAVTTGIIRLRNARSQLEDRLAALPARDKTRTPVQALIAKLSAIEDTLYQTRLRADEDGLVYPPRSAERLSSLTFVAGAGDGAPTQPARDVFAMFAPDLQRGLTALNAALTTDLAAVNAALARAKRPAVTPGNSELRPPAGGR